MFQNRTIEEEHSRMNCPSCKQTLSGTPTFCPRCGTRLFLANDRVSKVMMGAVAVAVGAMVLGEVGGYFKPALPAVVVTAALAAATAGIWLRRLRAPLWVPAVLGLVAALLISGNLDKASLQGDDTILLLVNIAGVVWTGAGAYAWFRTLPGAPQVGGGAAAAAQWGGGPAAAGPAGTGVAYGRRLGGNYRYVVVGMAICLISTVIQWVPDTYTTRQVDAGTHREGNWIVHEWRTQTDWHPGDHGTTVVGSFMLVLMVYVASGFVGLRIMPANISRIITMVGIALNAFLALKYLAWPGPGIGTLLYLAGGGLAVYGGYRTYGLNFRP